MHARDAHNPHDPSERTRPPVILSPERHRLAFLNAPFIGLIKLYQLILSPLMGRGCRFEPTCSTYGLAAYRHHQPLRATWLTATRILRCNPLCKGGYDPVPPVRRPTADRRASADAAARAHAAPHAPESHHSEAVAPSRTPGGPARDR
jgi:putative membrane protein insertion efficiency factor